MSFLHLRHIPRLTVLALSLLTAVNHIIASDNNATAIMQQCVQKLQDAPSATMDFTILNDLGETKGSMTMSKRFFKFFTPQLSVWFDGTTQWTYLKENNEVNITEPTGDELMESNPFELISSFRHNFDCQRLTSTPSYNIVELKAKSPAAPILSAKITINKSSALPSSIVFVSDSGKTTSISISNITIGRALQQSDFAFDKKSYPKVEMVDLR